MLQGLGFGLDEKAAEAARKAKVRLPSGKSSAAVLPFVADVCFQLPEGAHWRIEHAAYRFPPRGLGILELKRPAADTRPVVRRRYERPDDRACLSGGGSVTLGFELGTDGKPAEVALRAAGLWRYSPALRDGKPIALDAEVLLACGSPNESQAAAGALRIGDGVSSPRLSLKVEPSYTEGARKAKYQGPVVLYIEIAPEGHARNMGVERALGMGLDEEAIEAVLQWRFEPGMRAGKPVTVAATVEGNFRLL